MNFLKSLGFLSNITKSTFKSNAIKYRKVFIERFFVNNRENMIAIYFGDFYKTGIYELVQDVRKIDNCGKLENLDDLEIIEIILKSPIDEFIGVISGNWKN